MELLDHIFDVLRKLHTVFHGSYTDSHSHQHCRTLPFLPTSSPVLVISSSFLITANLTGMRGYFIMVLIQFLSSVCTCHLQILPNMDSQIKPIPSASHDDGEANNGAHDNDVKDADDRR